MGLKHKMYLLLLALVISVMTVHFKTENVNGVAITWGILYAMIFLMGGEWMKAPFVGFTAFAVAWSLFSLANYLEESFFLRIIVLVIGMVALIQVPPLIVGISLNIIDGLF